MLGKHKSFALLLYSKFTFVWGEMPIKLLFVEKNIQLSLCCYAASCHLLGKRQSFALLLNSKLSFVVKTPIFRVVAMLQVVICWENTNLTLCCYAASCHLLGKHQILRSVAMLQVVICWENTKLTLCCYAASCHLLGKHQTYALLLCCKLSFVGKTPNLRSVAMLQVVICWENTKLTLCCYAASCHLLGKHQTYALLLCCKLSFVGKTPILRSIATLQVVICWPHIAATLRAFCAESLFFSDARVIGGLDLSDYGV